MKKLPRLYFILTFGLVLVGCGTFSTTPGAARPPIALATIEPLTMTVTPTAATATAFDAQRAYEHIKTLAVTSRVAGSPDGYKAGDYIAARFAAYGLAVQKQEFTFDAWEDMGTTVETLGANGRKLDAQPIQYSPSGAVEGEVVAVNGAGSADDFRNADVKGKLALVSRGTLQFLDKSRNAANAGAAGILIYNTQPELFGGTMRERATIPTLALSGRDGQTLLAALKQGAVQARITSQTQVSSKTGRNIIGTRAGDANKVLILGGHYDSVAAGPGANDNGSGTGVLLELSRVLSPGNHNETLTFIAFDGEEFGLLGSQYYVKNLSSDERSKIKAMLNFDMLAGGSGPLLLGGRVSAAAV